jgi:hypothetical protein
MKTRILSRIISIAYIPLSIFLVYCLFVCALGASFSNGVHFKMIWEIACFFSIAVMLPIVFFIS